MSNESTSRQIAEKLKDIAGERVEIFEIELLYEEEVAEYIKGIEDAHNKSAKSKLVFGGPR